MWSMCALHPHAQSPRGITGFFPVSFTFKTGHRRINLWLSMILNNEINK